MEHAMTELPLAIFTTLAPIGAGGFVALAIAFLTTTFAPDQLKKLDKLAFIPLIVTAVGLAASFVHLASPMNAVHVFAHLGVSPLSNEIVAAMVFMVIALVYCILAVAGKLSNGARKGFLVVVALAALVFAVFTGWAYAVETIPAWNTPLTPVETVGSCLFGGVLLGGLLVMGSGGYRETRGTSFKTIMYVVLFLGFLLLLIGSAGRFVTVEGMSNAVINGIELASGLMIYMVAFAALLLVALVLGIFAFRGRGSTALLATATIAAIIAIFIGRLLFYAMQVSVGIQVTL